MHGGADQSVIRSSSDAPLIVRSTDAYTGIQFTDTGGSGQVFYNGSSDHLYLHSSKFSVAGSTLATGFQFQVNGSANFTNDVSIAGTQVLNSSRDLKNLGGVYSNGIFQFLTMGSAAQAIRTRSVFAGTSYGDTPPDGSVNATNSYEQNGTTVIDNSRNLVNIGTIASTGEIGVTNGTPK